MKKEVKAGLEELLKETLQKAKQIATGKELQDLGITLGWNEGDASVEISVEDD